MGSIFTDDVHTDSPYLHDGLISIFVLLFHMSLGKCICDVACCDVMTFLCFDHCGQEYSSHTNGWTCYFIALHIHALCASICTMLDFIVLSLFSVQNRSDSITLCLSDLLSEHLCTGMKHDLLFRCFISL